MLFGTVLLAPCSQKASMIDIEPMVLVELVIDYVFVHQAFVVLRPVVVILNQLIVVRLRL